MIPDYLIDVALPSPRRWKDEVRAAMRDQRITQVELAKRTGASQAGISQALSPSQLTSRYVAAISRALNVPLPVAVLDGELVARLYAAAVIVGDISPEALHAAVVQLESLAAALTRKGGH